MLSIAVRRYVVGSRGKWEGGGVPGRRGWRGEGLGGGDRRSWWRMRAMFCLMIENCQLCYALSANGTV